MFAILPIAAFLLVDLLLLSVCTDLSWRRVLIWTAILSCEDEHPDFHPCAIICEVCLVAWNRPREMPVVWNDQTFRLYLQTFP
jgi:hypothetical protein